MRVDTTIMLNDLKPVEINAAVAYIEHCDDQSSVISLFNADFMIIDAGDFR